MRKLPTHRPPTHPGEILLEKFLKPLGINQVAFVDRLGISYPWLNELINGRQGMTPDTALRLGRVLGMPADFWLTQQQDWDLWTRDPLQANAIQRLKPLAVNSR